MNTCNAGAGLPFSPHGLIVKRSWFCLWSLLTGSVLSRYLIGRSNPHLAIAITLLKEIDRSAGISLERLSASRLAVVHFLSISNSLIRSCHDR